MSEKKLLPKTKYISFQILLLGWEDSTHSNFASGWEDSTHPVNWSPTHSTGPQTLFFTDISVSVAQIKRNQTKNLKKTN